MISKITLLGNPAACRGHKTMGYNLIPLRKIFGIQLGERPMGLGLGEAYAQEKDDRAEGCINFQKHEPTPPLRE